MPRLAGRIGVGVYWPQHRSETPCPPWPRATICSDAWLNSAPSHNVWQTRRAHFGPRLKAAKLYGSAARGDWVEGESDVDILLLLDEVASADVSWIVALGLRHGIKSSGVIISALPMTAAHFQELRDRERLFAYEVDRDGVEL